MTGAATTPPPGRRRARPPGPPQPGGQAAPGACAETAHEAAVRIAAGLPPLTEAQRDRLAVLLGSVRPAAPRRAAA